jgi:formylmethanofuran:tetrahydromethanopterin formyltransferase
LSLKLGEAVIEDTFAEAFPMYATRIIINCCEQEMGFNCS